MNIDGYSEYGKEHLLQWQSFFIKLSQDELSMRIAVALDVQSSCDKCWIVTMKEILITGEDGLYTCSKCTEEMNEDSKK